MRDEAYYGESSLYIEAPVSPQTSVIVAPWIQNGAGTGPDGWRADATFAVKRALLRTDNTAMAVQVGAIWRSDPDNGCGEGGAEVRWLGGRNFGERGQTFLNIELAARVLEGGCGSARIDVTAGYHHNERWMAMAQVFTDDPQWGEREGDQAMQAQLTLVRFSEEARGVQFGVRARLDNDDAEPMLVLAFWGRPGD